MPRFAASLSTMFAEWEFLDRFRAAREAGFRAVECQDPYPWAADAVAEQLSATGLDMVLINTPAGDCEAGDHGLAAIPGVEGAFRRAFETALDYARPLACPWIHVLAGVVPDAIARETAIRTYVDNVGWAARAAAADGRGVLIEPINTVDLPGYFLSRTRDARELLERIGADNVFLQFDVYHAHRMGERAADAIPANLDAIRHVQVSGAPGRHEPVAGEIDYPALFRRLDEIGYGAWIGCEYRPRAGTLEGLGWARDYGIGGDGALDAGAPRRA